MIEVLNAGPLTLVQDLGRPGWAASGVGPSGAADAEALRLANRLVGNEENAAGLEITLGQVILRALTPLTVAVTGAPGPVRARDSTADMNGPIHLRPRDPFRIGPPVSGVRTYLAVRGGISGPRTLGSQSADVLSGLGPPRVRDGQILSVGQPSTRWLAALDHAPTAHTPDVAVLRLIAGPRADWFHRDALTLLTSGPYVVSPDSNRIAVRLRGEAIQRANASELPPEGLVTGAVQVPHDGQPLIFGVDRPVTGGYPVLAVVIAADISKIAQLRPGQSAHFKLRVPAYSQAD